MPPGKTGRGPGGDVTRVDVEPLQHRLARLGQLLHGVHDDDLIVDAQVLQQGLVGELVNARLVSPQVDRHAIGGLVVERLQQALPGGERFAAGFGGVVIGVDSPLKAVPPSMIVSDNFRHFATRAGSLTIPAFGG